MTRIHLCTRSTTTQPPQDFGRQVEELGTQIQAWRRNGDLSGRLVQVPGIRSRRARWLLHRGATSFDGGAQLAAWLGLVPKQHSFEGKSNLLGMNKRGDS